MLVGAKIFNCFSQIFRIIFILSNQISEGYTLFADRVAIIH